MAQYAVCTGFNAAMDSNDMTTLTLEVTFFNTDGGTLVTEGATVPAVINPNALLSLIHDKIVDAIVAYASTAFSWTITRPRVLHPQLAKGLVV